MLVFVHKAHATLLPQWRHPNLGRLLSPRQFSRAADTVAAGLPVAADNDCFQRLDVGAFKAMLEAVRGIGCLFIVCPDVVADARATGRRFSRWRDHVAASGPVALVAQDGLVTPPWDDLDCLFIGGSTEFKMGPVAAALAREAKTHGKWVHMGRVNTRRRFRYAKSIGCDSVDGTAFSMFTDTHLPWALEWAAAPQQLGFAA